MALSECVCSALHEEEKGCSLKRCYLLNFKNDSTLLIFQKQSLPISFLLWKHRHGKFQQDLSNITMGMGEDNVKELLPSY